MILLAITSQTWLVTGLGFGLVLVLLYVFVYIMKLLGFIMQPKEKKAQPAAKADDATKAAIATTIALNSDEADMAAIAMTLNLYYGVHDIEPAQLTIRPHHSMWKYNH